MRTVCRECMGRRRVHTDHMTVINAIRPGETGTIHVFIPCRHCEERGTIVFPGTPHPTTLT